MWIISHISEKLTNCLSVLGYLAGLALKKFSFQKQCFDQAKSAAKAKSKEKLQKA